MQKVLFFLFIFFNLSYACQHACKPFGVINTHYQDIVVKGYTVCPLGFGQKCESRCKEVEKIIQSYNRPITLLDFGAAEGYFAFKLAPKFPDSIFVMIEESNPFLFKLCEHNAMPNIIFLKKNMSVEALQELAQKEHFDIVITLNVLHHFHEKWPQALDAILALGDKIIIENPPAMDLKTAHFAQINDCLREKSTKLLCVLPRWTRPHLKSFTYYIDQKKDDADQKVSLNKPGINQETFKKLNGVYPTQVSDDLAKKIFR